MRLPRTKGAHDSHGWCALEDDCGLAAGLKLTYDGSDAMRMPIMLSFQRVTQTGPSFDERLNVADGVDKNRYGHPAGWP